ncbi:MAG: chloride channel protein [Candidatus Krumholzibacteria bacterium]|nr:chloride channel protein [Candidatus Krumholzibacteria bacterium]
MKRGAAGTAAALARLVALALLAGIPAALMTALFTDSLAAAVRLIEPIPPHLRALLPPAAALAAGMLILRRWPDAGGEGMQSYINGVSLRGGRLDAPSTLLKFPATILTLSMCGSGGIVGPLARICAGIGSALTRLALRASPPAGGDDLRIGTVCGFSGAIASIFHSPLGGALFAAEILRRDSIRYADVIPAALAGSAAYGTSAWLLGRGPVFSFESPAPDIGLAGLAWLIPVALGAGAAGMLFIAVFNGAARYLHRLRLRQPAPALAGSVLLCAALLLGAGWAFGDSPALMSTLESGELARLPLAETAGGHIAAALLAITAVKIVLTAVTVGSGMSGGLTGPLLIIGAAAGALIGTLAGAAPGSPFLFACMACGLSAILGAALNVPLAAIVLTTGMFGTGYVLPAIAGAIPAFLVFKGRTVYDYFRGDEGGNRDAD